MARLLFLALLAAQACSDPKYPNAESQDGGRDASASAAIDGPKTDARVAEDAGEELIASADSGLPTETAVDGGKVALGSSMPDWAAPLLGRYAARSYQFSQDKAGTKLRNREYLLIDIVEISGEDPHVELRLRMCDSFNDGMTAESRVSHPESATVRIHRILFGDHSWFTQTSDSVDGFTRALPARCQGKEGDAVEKDPAQSWIAGSTCLCPSSIEVAPNRPDDCRIVDQDMDGNPGSSLSLTPKLFFGPATLFATTINRSTFVNGVVASNGHHTAQVAVDQYGWQLGCDPAPCADVATNNTPANCPPVRNKLELVPQPELEGCQEVIDNAAALFPTGLPDYPASCP